MLASARHAWVTTPTRIRIFLGIVCFSCLTLFWFFSALSPSEQAETTSALFTSANGFRFNEAEEAGEPNGNVHEAGEEEEEEEEEEEDQGVVVEVVDEENAWEQQLAWIRSLTPGECDPLRPECDVAWRHWLVSGNITKVSDPPECCRGWHAFDMFTVEYDHGAYKGILKIRKQAEMTSDLVGYHVERLLQLNRSLPVFGVVFDRSRYEHLLAKLKEQGVTPDDAQRRQKRWEEMMVLHTWVGRVTGELQPFFTRPFVHVDGSVCAKMPDEELHPRVVFQCRNRTLPPGAPKVGHQGAFRSEEERLATCSTYPKDIVDLLVFDYLTNQVDRKGNCFVDQQTGHLLFLDNDSGSWDPARPYPHGSGCCYPSLKRVRLRDILDEKQRVTPAFCKFGRSTIDILRRASAAPGGLGARLQASLSTDSAFDAIDTAFSQFQAFDPYLITNKRVDTLLAFVDECLQAFGEETVLIN